MGVERALNFDDLRALAKRRLPRIVFDFIEGGCDDESGLQRNRDAFRKFRLMPRYLVDASRRDQGVTLFGRRYDSPFGICPMGLVGLAQPGTDLLLAKAAAEFNLPYLMSNASNASIEQAAALAPHNTWFQIYMTVEDKINRDLVRRARDLGLTTLVVTVDVPENSNRERNRRNGFSRPPKMSLPVLLDAALHPGWVLRFLLSGRTPPMGNWDPYAAPGSERLGGADLYGKYTPARQTDWKRLDEIRALWSGNLVLKGILSPADAQRAVAAGVNGIIGSNQGGRQLDMAPSPIEVLPWIKAAVGDRAELLLDSGVRRGADIVIALALGAKCALFGRPWLYASVAGRGAPGVSHAVAIMRREVDIIMGQIGLAGLDHVPAATVWAPDGPRVGPAGAPDRTSDRTPVSSA